MHDTTSIWKRRENWVIRIVCGACLLLAAGGFTYVMYQDSHNPVRMAERQRAIDEIKIGNDRPEVKVLLIENVVDTYLKQEHRLPDSAAVVNAVLRSQFNLPGLVSRKAKCFFPVNQFVGYQRTLVDAAEYRALKPLDTWVDGGEVPGNGPFTSIRPYVAEIRVFNGEGQLGAVAIGYVDYGREPLHMQWQAMPVTAK